MTGNLKPALFLALLALPLTALAQPSAGPQHGRTRVHQVAHDDGTGQPVFGWQLMTAEEMAAQRTKMRAAATPEERERIRAEHHAQMLERARQRGVTLPEEPPAGGQRGDPER